jgi:uncharacterized protein YjbI with pentapeptide repeats
VERQKNAFQGHIRDEAHEKFNKDIGALDGKVDLENCDLSNQDLRKFNLRCANLKNTYLKMADLRGVDLSQAQLEGASINGARISGAFFPQTISAQEILLSVQHGTSLRCRG